MVKQKGKGLINSGAEIPVKSSKSSSDIAQSPKANNNKYKYIIHMIVCHSYFY